MLQPDFTLALAIQSCYASAKRCSAGNWIWHSGPSSAIRVPPSDVTVPNRAWHGAMPVPSECHCRMSPCHRSAKIMPGRRFSYAGLHAFFVKTAKIDRTRNRKIYKRLMLSGAHLGASRSSQSSGQSQSVFGPFWGRVRPGIWAAAEPPATRKGLCTIGIYERPAAGGATGLVVDSDGLSNPKTGGGGSRTRVPEHFKQGLYVCSPSVDLDAWDANGQTSQTSSPISICRQPASGGSGRPSLLLSLRRASRHHAGNGLLFTQPCATVGWHLKCFATLFYEAA